MAARFVFAVIHQPTRFPLGREIVSFEILGIDRAAYREIYGFLQHGENSLPKLFGPRPRYAIRAELRMNASREQRFGRIDIPDATYLCLIEEYVLQASL